MILLAIDTATECCSAALWVDGKLYSRSAVKSRLHAELILPFIDELLIEAEINKSEIQGIVVGIGPGAFTGVRIATGVAQGIALALDIKVVAVSNLKTLAYKAYQQIDLKESQTITVAADARMQEVYTSVFEVSSHEIKTVIEENVCKPENLKLDETVMYIGNGFDTYPILQEFKKNNPMAFETNVYTQAEDMLLMVKDQFDMLCENIENIEPVYLRSP